MDDHHIASFKIEPVELLEWRCVIFGGEEGIIWNPEKGKVPSAWVRFWMRVFFGSRWIRDQKEPKK